MSMPSPISLTDSLLKNLAFHSLLEQEVEKTPFGTITVNVMLKNGVADLNTLNIVKNVRKKYSYVDNEDVG